MFEGQKYCILSQLCIAEKEEKKIKEIQGENGHLVCEERDMECIIRDFF